MLNSNANLAKLFLQRHLSAIYGFCSMTESHDKAVIDFKDANGEHHEIIIQHRKVVR